jgi:hypothetical protein
VEVDGFVFKRKRQRTEQESSGPPADEYQETEQSQTARPQHSTGNSDALLMSQKVSVDAATLNATAKALLEAVRQDNDPQQILPGFCELLAQVISLSLSLPPSLPHWGPQLLLHFIRETRNAKRHASLPKSNRVVGWLESCSE